MAAFQPEAGLKTEGSDQRKEKLATADKTRQNKTTRCCFFWGHFFLTLTKEGAQICTSTIVVLEYPAGLARDIGS